MARGLFAFALLGAWLVACSGNPDGPLPGSASERAGKGDTGTVNLPLTADTNGATYRLQKAVFNISGSALATPLVVKPPADTPVDTETLPVGSFSALLKDGWVLERRGPGATDFVTVRATLISPNPIDFKVTKGGTTDVFFGFATNGGDVGLGTGTTNIHIAVQDCTEFNGIAASLASMTIDCTGTLGPDSYSVSADGVLSRNFDACTPQDKTKLVSIDQLLSLQLRSVRLPFVKDCIAGRWADWKASLSNVNGVTTCPTWVKQGIVNEATDAQIDKLIPELVRLSQTPDNGTRPQFLQLLDQGYTYGVAFPNGPPQGSKCQTAGDCAAVCAGGFPGFVVRNDAGTVLTDGPYWLLDNTYPTAAQDPFLKANYYHPMSYYGPSPGTQWATRARFSPCTPGSGVVCPAEMCSYGPSHIHIQLKCDCLDPTLNATCPADNTGCVGYCNP